MADRMFGWGRCAIAAAAFAMLLESIPAALGEQPVLRIFTTEDGLARNWVKRIRRDRAGRLWFCTVEGLSSFDGERFTNYTVADGLPHRYVADFLDTGNGRYLVVTEAGLHQFRPRTGIDSRPSFTAVSYDPPGDPVDYPSQGDPRLFQSRSGEVWLGTGAGLYRIETGESPRAVLRPLRSLLGLPSEPDVSAIDEDTEGNLWLVAGRKLACIRRDGHVKQWGAEIGLPTAPKALLHDREGRIWAGGWGTLAVLEVRDGNIHLIARFKTADLSPVADVMDLFQDDSGEIWLGGAGVARFPSHASLVKDSWQLFDGVSPLMQDTGSIAADPQGNVWLAASNIGAVRVLRHGFSRFTETDGLASLRVFSVFETSEGKLYAVTEPGHVLNEFDGRRFFSIRWRAPAQISGPGWGEASIALRNRRGEWWFAGEGGLVRFPAVIAARDLMRVQSPRVFSMQEGLPFNTVLRVYEEKSGAVWVTGQGAVRWNPATNTFQNFSAELETAAGEKAYPVSFAQDATEHAWFGLDTGALLRFQGSRFERVRSGVPSGVLNGLCIDHAGRLWIASSSGGLGRIDSPTAPDPAVRLYTQNDGLATNHLFAVIEDHAGRIYVAGGKGVDRLDPRTGNVHHYLPSDGLPAGETQRLYCDRGGGIWFASNLGLSRYQPEDDQPISPASPKIHSVRAGGTFAWLSDDGEDVVRGVDLPPGKDDIEIAYGSVDFSASHTPKYQYRLLPVDADWRKPTTLRSVQYARLGTARYTFEVRGLNTEGDASLTIARVEFRVLPPIWQRAWFLLLACAVVAGMAYAAHTYRLRQLVAVQRIRTRLASDLHDDVGSGLAEIAILTELARQRAALPEAQAMEFVAERARELRTTMGDIVWSIDPASDNLTSVIRRWRQIAAGMLGGTSLTFTAPPEDATDGITLRPDHRRHLLLLFKETVTNVARHAQAPHVAIEVFLTSGLLTLRIRDDGRGFESEQKNWGNGLRSLARRAQELKGTLTIRSEPRAGTTVEFELPA